MADWETTIIPLEEAQHVFTAFGVGPHSPDYERYRRGDGYRHVDLEEVLCQSNRILVVDWREWLQDAVDTIQEQLQEIGIVAAIDLGEQGEQGSIRTADGSDNIKYVPADDDNFEDVIRAFNRVIGSQAQYRKLRSCEGSDTWAYGLLTNDAWRATEATAASTVQLLFAQVEAA